MGAKIIVGPQTENWGGWVKTQNECLWRPQQLQVLSQRDEHVARDDEEGNKLTMGAYTLHGSCTASVSTGRIASSSQREWSIYLLVARDGNGPGRPRAGPENPGPRALRVETGLLIFYLRLLRTLCAGRWVVTRELCIVVTCKCVVYWTNVHENCITVCACDLWTRYD